VNDSDRVQDALELIDEVMEEHDLHEGQQIRTLVDAIQSTSESDSDDEEFVED